MNQDITLRNYFASRAMDIVLAETQETITASTWDWVKSLLVLYLHMDFLHVKRINVENVYKEAAVKAFEYADEMIKQSVVKRKD